MRLTQKQIDALRLTTPHACITDLAKVKEGAPAEFIEDLNTYLSHFAAPSKEKGQPCLACGEALNGDLVSALMGKGGFEWGLVHGQGHCRNCGWPTTAYHFIKDRHGEELATIHNVLLQAHPDDITVKKP